MAEPAGDGWYLAAPDYWMAPDGAADMPVRQGDLFGPCRVGRQRWAGALLVHPTCEVVKPAVASLQVVRVRPLSDVASESMQRRVVAGWHERGGSIRVAFANTFFLAPAPPGLDAPMFADFREVALLPRGELQPARRVAAMTHDCRVALIRRKIYFRYRWLLSFRQVRELEALRIGSDPEFAGPRPEWAPAPGA